MHSSFFTDCFDTAKENMSFDEQLLSRSDFRVVRYYIWSKPSITYPIRLQLPVALQVVDHSERVTGGGLVFHQPGDILYTLILSRTDPRFSSRIKVRMKEVSQLFKRAFLALGIQIDGAVSQQQSRDIQYCTTYHNPYELYYEGQKVMGIAVRRFREKDVFQCIIHCASRGGYFNVISKQYHDYVSQGLLMDSQQKLRLCQIINAMV